MIVAYVSLGIAVITLIIALLIHSETRDVLGHIKAITYTLPGTYDVDRLREDIEKTGEIRGKVICVASKHTHIDWAIPAYDEIPRGKRIKIRFWKFLSKLSNYLSGNIDIPVVPRHSVQWDITSGLISSSEVSKLLMEGWEPFSVTNDNEVWLRKEIIKEKEADS